MTFFFSFKGAYFEGVLEFNKIQKKLYNFCYFLVPKIVFFNFTKLQETGKKRLESEQASSKENTWLFF